MTTARLDVDGAVARITLDEPERLNPLGRQMLDSIVEATAGIAEASEVRVVVVAGAGRAFTAGADLEAFKSAEGLTRLDADAGRRMAEAVEGIEAITVAKIHGHCVGGGVVLAAACDLRVASSDTRFSIPEVALGIPLAWGGIPRLVREVGPAVTKELVMTCRPFDADEAQRIGFLNTVVPPEALDEEVDRLVSILLSQPAGPLLATKRHVNEVTRRIADTDQSWRDADALVAAMQDAESGSARQRYLDDVRGS